MVMGLDTGSFANDPDWANPPSPLIPGIGKANPYPNYPPIRMLSSHVPAQVIQSVDVKHTVCSKDDSLIPPLGSPPQEPTPFNSRWRAQP